MAGLSKPYEVITDHIISQLEHNEIPWRKPWSGDAFPRSLQTGNPYRGLNVFMLTCDATIRGYSSPWWVTFKQAKAQGGSVKKGATSTPVVFWKLRKVEDRDESTEESRTKEIPVLKYYRIFNLDQCTGLEAPAMEQDRKPLDFDPIIQCERIVAEMPRPPTIQHNQPQAYYRASTDVLNMPKPEEFHTHEGYYATLFHELIHSTGHSTRLDRPGITTTARFGSAEYAKEELIAEMGATFLCSRSNIAQTTLENAAAYIRSWLKCLRKNPKIVIQAASAAQKAVDYIVNEESARTAEKELGQRRIENSR